MPLMYNEVGFCIYQIYRLQERHDDSLLEQAENNFQRALESMDHKSEINYAGSSSSASPSPSTSSLFSNRSPCINPHRLQARDVRFNKDLMRLLRNKPCDGIESNQELSSLKQQLSADISKDLTPSLKHCTSLFFPVEISLICDHFTSRLGDKKKKASAQEEKEPSPTLPSDFFRKKSPTYWNQSDLLQFSSRESPSKN